MLVFSREKYIEQMERFGFDYMDDWAKLCDGKMVFVRPSDIDEPKEEITYTIPVLDDGFLCYYHALYEWCVEIEED